MAALLRRTSVVAVAGLVGLALFATPLPARAETLSRIAVPDIGVLFGAWVDADGDWTTVSDAQREVTDFESELGRKLDINQHYYAWTDPFPTTLETWDRLNGRLSLVSWEPWSTNLNEINSGKHDALIRQRARDMASFGTKIFFRWGHEMNGNWYPWSGSKNGNDPQRYIEAYRRIHSLFAQEGASNVVWIWSPNHVSVPNQSWNHWSEYYPGDDYVDWVGPDGYNWGTRYSWSDWTSFASIFREIYDTYAPRKPIIIPETASVEEGGNITAWIAEMWKTIAVDMPRIKALLWFNAPIAPLDGKTSTLNMARRMAQHELFVQEPDQERPDVLSANVYLNSTKRRAKVVYRLDEPADTAVKVYDRYGRWVRTIKGWSVVAPRFKVARWDGRNAKGRRVRAGWYRVFVTAWDEEDNHGWRSRWVRIG